MISWMKHDGPEIMLHSWIQIVSMYMTAFLSQTAIWWTASRWEPVCWMSTPDIRLKLLGNHIPLMISSKIIALDFLFFFLSLSVYGLFCSKLFKSVVDDKKDQFLTLDHYIARRQPVAHSSLFPASSNQWTISDRDTNSCFFYSFV